MSTDTEKLLYGDYSTDTLKEILEEYEEVLPEEDLASDAIINTAVLFVRALFYGLNKDHPYRWEGDIHGAPDLDATGITIVTEHPINKEVVEKRPAVLLRMGPRQFSGFHLDQFKHLNVPTYAQTKHDLIRGVMTATVISRHGHEALRLADWIGQSFRLLNRYLTFGRFHSIHPAIQWSPVQKGGNLVNGASENDFMQASASFRYTWDWTGRVSVSKPTATFEDLHMTIVSYGIRALDGNSPEGGIVDPDSFTQLMAETEE